MAVGTTLFRLHRRVISPDKGRAPLMLARGALRLASAGYGAGVRLRNGLYDLGLRSSRAATAPVISVGNITAGGTGKTPFVAWLARLMVIHKMRPAILSRGYGRHDRLGVDDENLMLAQQLADIPVVVDANRVRGARTAVRQHGAEVLLLDDGFQHRRIARDLDIVLVDAVWPFGAGYLLPRGLLREPLRELRRAGFLVVTRAGLVDAERREAIKSRLAALAPRVPTALCDTVVEGLEPLHEVAASSCEPSELREGPWGAFCGVGNPEGFRLTLENAGCRPAFLRVFADHERYAPKQIEGVIAEAQNAECRGIVTTEKDAVKVKRLPRGRSRLPFYAVRTAMEFTEGSEALVAAILKAVGRTP